MSEPVAVGDAGAVRTVRLDAPERMNALNTRTFELVTDALSGAAEDPAIACVVLTGTGRAFTAGMDLADDGTTAERRRDAWLDFITAIEGFAKPLVVGVNGMAVGFGTTVLGHADIAVAAESARFKAPFASLGLVPEAGASATLPALIGTQRAAQLFFTGGWMSAAEALDAGLVMRIVPDENLTSVLAEIGEAIASQSIDALVATKRLLLEARLPAARAAREREQVAFDHLMAGPDYAEALAAFGDKRKPDFSRR